MSDLDSTVAKNIQDSFKKGETKKADVPIVEGAAKTLDKNTLGYNLVRMTLFIVGGFLVFLMVAIVFFKGVDVPTNLINQVESSDSLSVASKELLNMYVEERENEREFFLKISQIVLLNLLLPIITAIVGFIFGSEGLRARNNEQ